MKRHVALQNLSSDHHKALRLARDLEEAGRAGRREASRTLSQLQTTWNAEVIGHLAWEERWFGRIIAGTVEHEQLLSEHWNLRKHVDAVLQSPPTDGSLHYRLGHIGALLRAHIRWEERILMPLVERTASKEDLAQMLEAAQHPGSGF
ncbi:MAG: hemerythrin domain-containing protein [Myxococcales bacterium]|nr:hemerythrin domain-containing protein [Myxococcales bacterium]